MFSVIHWDLNKMRNFPNGRDRCHGAPWRSESIGNPIYFMLCIFWLYKNMPKYFKNLFRSLGGQCRHQRPSKTLIIYSTQWEFSVLPSCIAFLTWYMPIYMWGSWWWGSYSGGQVATRCQLGANVHTSYQPTVFEPNQKFQEATLSINISALTWFGLIDLNMRRRRRHTHGGLA